MSIRRQAPEGRGIELVASVVAADGSELLAD
jgi:hypothetical protein